MMRIARRFWPLFFTFALAAPARGQVSLEWKFREGDTFYLESVTNLKQKMKVGDREFGQDLEQTLVVSFTVKKKGAADTNVLLEHKIEAMRFKGTTSAEPEEKFAKDLVGSTLLLTLNDKLEVTKIEGFEDLVKKLAGEDPAQLKLAQQVLSEDTVRKSAAELFGFLPGKAVEKGAKWERSATAPLGPLGSLSVKNAYTYDGKATEDGKPVEKISFTSTATYAAPKAGADAGAAFKVTEANLKADDGHGTILFDAAAGRLVQATSRIRLKGPLTISVMNTPVKADVDQETTTKTRVSDKNPAAK